MSFFERSRFSQRGKRFLKLVPGQQERAARILPELGPEEGALLQAQTQQPLQVFRCDQGKDGVGGKIVGEHEQEAIVVLDDLQVVTVFFLPGGLKGQAEGPVDPSAPEGVEYHLLRARGIEGVLKMLDEQVVAVGEVGSRRLPLPLQVADQFVGGAIVEEIVPEKLFARGTGRRGGR